MTGCFAPDYPVSGAFLYCLFPPVLIGVALVPKDIDSEYQLIIQLLKEGFHGKPPMDSINWA